MSSLTSGDGLVAVSETQQDIGEAVNDYIAAAKAVQARHFAYLSAADIDGLLANGYTRDARIHTFGYRAGGRVPLGAFVEAYLQRLQEFDDRRIDYFAAGKAYIWQELTLRSSTRESAPVKLYEFKFLRGDKVYLQLLGERSETGWLTTAFAEAGGQETKENPAAQALHRRYIDYQTRGDADGMADAFFSEDARLATAQVQLEGRENLRAFFQHKFQEDSGFHLVSIRNITGDDDYVWFEATAASRFGERTVYDVMLVNAGLVSLQLVGTLEGDLPPNRS